ncbi:MAG: CvpA family protein [Alphaproteobacteria bacterium]
MTLPFEFVDVIVATILIISGLIGYFRGLVREVLSLATWIGAVLVTLYGFAHVQPYVRQVISMPVVADIVTGVGLFLITLVILTLINHTVSGRVKDSVLGAIDHGLGFLFGIVRGALLVCVAYIAVSWVWAEHELDPYFQDARTIPMVKQGAEMLNRLIPKEMRHETRSAVDGVRESTQQAIESRKVLEDLERLGAPLPDAEKAPAYKDSERRDMQRLIDGKQ